MKNKQFETLIALTLELGAHSANIIDVKDISLDRSFRDLCTSNACGLYGQCWMCPPEVGQIDVLMEKIRQYEHALVYQTVTALEDSYDFEGMMEGKKRTYPLAQKLRKIFAQQGISTVLHLGAGGCGVCQICAKRAGEPCRFPELAMASLEAYGVNVSQLAKAAGMKYVNGQNTVTYFGAVLFCLDEEQTCVKKSL